LSTKARVDTQSGLEHPLELHADKCRNPRSIDCIWVAPGVAAAAGFAADGFLAVETSPTEVGLSDSRRRRLALGGAGTWNVSDVEGDGDMAAAEANATRGGDVRIEGNDVWESPQWLRLRPWAMISEREME